MRVKELFAFIWEREIIREKKESGAPKPWTKDPILQTYRFCNVYRERDTVTQWIAEHWLGIPNEDTWFAMTVARFLNKPTTLAHLGYPVPWSARDFKRLLKSAPRPLFSAAYMVRSDPGDKVVYLADKVLTPLWRDRTDVRPRKGDTLAQFAARLSPYYGMGSFMIGQVIADTKFVPPLSKAQDWWTWAVPGPGSRRGLNRVYNEDPGLQLREELWQADFRIIQTKIDPLMCEAGMPRLSAQDLQNCLCEFDKYERARLGEGRPKQRYPGV